MSEYAPITGARLMPDSRAYAMNVDYNEGVLALDGAIGQAKADSEVRDGVLADRISTHTHDGRYYVKVPTDVPLLDDTFSRTGPLAGSEADSGQVWQSTYTAWTTDGQKAVADALALASVPVPGDIHRAVFDLEVVTAGGASRALSLVLGGFNDLWATVTRNSAGGCYIAVHKRFDEPGTVTIIPAFGVLSPNYSAPQSLTVTISVLDGVVTVTADGITRTAEISAAEQGMIDPTIGLVANNDITGLALTRVRAFAGGRPADALAPMDHHHTISDVDGLQAALDDIDTEVTIDDVPGLRKALDRIDGLGEALADLVPVEAGDDLIASRLAFRAGDITVGVASDSTSDGATDWPRMWEAHMAQRFPHLRIEHQQWVDAQGAYGPTTVVQEGEGEPAFSGTLLHDTFTRTSNLATPDEGGPWTVTTPDAFTLTGSALAVTGPGRLRLVTGARDMTTSVGLDLDTTGTGAAQTHYIYHGWTHGSMVQILVNAAGLVTAYIYRRVANVNEVVTSQRLDLALGVPINGAAGPLTVEFTTAIQNHSVTIGYGGRSWSHQWTITEDAYAAMETEMSIFPQSATPGMLIDEVTVAVDDRPATYQTLKVLCGTKGGGTLDYQRQHWEGMFGREIITPGTPGTSTPRTITDQFTRTGELAGTTTATGQTWGGTPGVWVGDGAAATATGAKIGQVTIPVPDATEAEFTVEAITAGTAASQTLRLGLDTNGDGVHGFFANFVVNTDGVFGASAYVRTPAGGYRSLGAITDHAVESSISEPQQVGVKIERDGLSFTLTAGAGQRTVTITQDEADQLGDMVEIQAATPALPGFRVLDMAATWAETTPPTAPVYGDPLDVMLISHGHNYGSMGGDQYVQQVEDFLAFMRERRPSTVPLFVSQNPQFAPAANPVAHARRQAAVRAFARRHGHGYAPVFEHFAAQPDGGQSWVSADGVHPTAPATPTITAGKGTSEWGGVLADATTD